jgi:hypothetical protein
MNMSEKNIDWEDKTKEILTILQKGAPHKELGEALTKYMQFRRPFALGRQSAQNILLPQSRLQDLVCGIPFVSKNHPWPKSEFSDLWMQPILQLNMPTLRNLYGVEWGDDLLQIWGHVALDHKTLASISKPFMLRVIPASDLVNPSGEEVPEWRQAGERKVCYLFSYEDFSGREVFEWYRAGDMYGSRKQLVEFIFQSLGDFSDEEAEWVDGVMRKLGESPLCGQNQINFIGGWGGQHGESDASCGDNLLLRISDGNGAVLAIHRLLSQSEKIPFRVDYSLR